MTSFKLMKWSHSPGSVARLGSYAVLTSMGNTPGAACFAFAIDVSKQFQRYKMKSKPTELSVTRDGRTVRPGDTVYVTCNGGPFERKIISECYAHKIAYTTPDSGGYEGAKLTIVYAEPDMHAWKLVKIPCWGAPYWMNDIGDYWLNRNGGRTPKSEGDVVSDTGFGQYRDLDHTKTGLAMVQSDAGWLSRAGRFYPCRSVEHENYADLIFHSSGRSMEKKGWVRVYSKREWIAAKRLSPDQFQWLHDRGYDTEDYNSDLAPHLFEKD